MKFSFLLKQFSSFSRVFFILSIFLFSSIAQQAHAGTDDNLTGFAWTDTFGWFSFNCSDGDNCIAGGGSSDYGVNIDRLSHNLNGYAWNDNVGWMSFQSSDTPPDTSFSSHCANTCNSAGHCTACFDLESGEIYGWAKLLSMGNDGWISLNCENDNSCATSDYSFILNPTASTFSGYAWGSSATSTGVGWMSFNCQDSGDCPNGDPLPCQLPYQLEIASGATLSIELPFQFDVKVSYGVRLVNNSPIINTLSAPNNNAETACLGSAKTALLNWSIFDVDASSYQTAYQVIVNDSNTSTGTPLYDSGKTTTTATQLTLSSSLSYDTSYYWWVKVWDEFDYSSDFTQFDHSATSSALTDNSAYNSTHSSDPDLTFTTYRHEFPDVDFTMTPKTPVQDQLTELIGSLYYYTDSQPTTAQTCSTSTCDILWSVTPTTTNTYLSSSTEATTKMIVDRASTSQSVILQATDNDGYMCSSSTSWGVNILPSWKEVNPAR